MPETPTANMRTVGITVQSACQDGILVRLPILALTIAMLALFVILPYQSLNADAATFGLMGNDLLRHGYLPTLTYGQNYLFSITSYVYALVRWLAPLLSCASALALAGSILSLTGLWLVCESFLAAQRLTCRQRFVPTFLFCLLIGASHSFIYDVSENSSIEISLFLSGLVFWASSRIEAAFQAGKMLTRGAWFTLGLAASYALYSRIQVVAYAVCLGGPLLFMIGRKAGWRILLKNTAWLGLGLFSGYVPMLCHHIFRAPQWSFVHHVHTPVGSIHNMAAALRLLWGGIMPRIFMISHDAPLYSVLIIGLVIVALAASGIALARRRGITVMDLAWVAGSLIILATMIILPNLSVNPESRRYCLTVFLAVVWLFCRFGVLSGRRGWPAAALVAAIVFLSVPQWLTRLQGKTQRNAQLRLAEKEFVPELMRLGAPVLCDYWDAYLLAFLSDGRLKIEAFPWQLVRTYGRLKEPEMRRQTLWLIRSGYGRTTIGRLKEDLGADALATLKCQDFSLRLFDRPCELCYWKDGSIAVELMNKYHPKYFTTADPPGSNQWPDRNCQASYAIQGGEVRPSKHDGVSK